MGGQHDMTKDKQIEENFSDILSMLKKKVQEKDEEIMRLEGNVQGEWVFCKGWNRK